MTDGSIENTKFGEQQKIPAEMTSDNIFIYQSGENKNVVFKISHQTSVIGFAHIVLSNDDIEAISGTLTKNTSTMLGRFRGDLEIITLLSVAVVIAISGLLGWRMYLSLSLPLQNMINAAEEFSQGNFEYQLPKKMANKSELGRLALALNKMAGDIKIAEEKIIQQAHFDSLTGLPNRFLTLDRLYQTMIEAQRNGEKVAVLFVDLDDFKKVNDSLGHEVGDLLLIEAANRLSAITRAGDTVGRLGGDEFILVLKRLADPIDASRTAEQLLSTIGAAFRVGGRDLFTTASVGIAVYPDNGETAPELLKNADSAMYHSKSLGRNTYSFFTKEMNENISRKLELEEQLHGALDRNEFRILYQPKYSVKDQKIVGAEALIRWDNLALGSVGPDEFIPITEKTGFIEAIGEFVLSEVIQQMQSWQAMFDTDFHVAVNISPRQLRTNDLIKVLRQLLARHTLRPGGLELEITEGVLMSATDSLNEIFAVVSELDIRIAMDDFGTGYSSLSYLRRYPFDVIKIDRTFVRDVTTDDADRELVVATIAMAQALNLQVVAEGVETQEQFDFLAAQGCDSVQGYFFSRPISADEMTDLLHKSS